MSHKFGSVFISSSSCPSCHCHHSDRTTLMILHLPQPMIIESAVYINISCHTVCKYTTEIILLPVQYTLQLSIDTCWTFGNNTKGDLISEKSTTLNKDLKSRCLCASNFVAAIWGRSFSLPEWQYFFVCKSQGTFIYTALYKKQIVSKQLYQETNRKIAESLMQTSKI